MAVLFTHPPNEARQVSLRRCEETREAATDLGPLKTREKDKAIKGRKQCEDDTFPAKVRKTQQSLDQ
uniref:Uncharacterized protein n=1 Tax=Magallana gigas TaxID=29159 RepID=K1QHZ7_MAGGI